jgi:multicomponent Na+:H+ antiporter subunit B
MSVEGSEVGEEMKITETKPLTFTALIIAIILIALSFYAVEDLPAFGDENSPANKYIKLFSVDADGLVESLNEGVLPTEIKAGIDEMGFIKGPTCPGCQDENYPSLSEGNYEIKYREKGTWLGGRLYTDSGWDVLIKEGELFYKEPQEYYFIADADGNLTVYRYNWPVRVVERTEEETAIINAVTSGLADYRGYDTMGEETVILTGAIGVILLVRRRGKL